MAVNASTGFESCVVPPELKFSIPSGVCDDSATRVGAGGVGTGASTVKLTFNGALVPASLVAYVSVRTCTPFDNVGKVQPMLVLVAVMVPITAPLSYRVYTSPGMAVNTSTGFVSCVVPPELKFSIPSGVCDDSASKVGAGSASANASTVKLTFNGALVPASLVAYVSVR